MALNSYQEKVVNELVTRVKSLESFVKDVRSIQTRILKYGNITINGTTNQITIGTTITLDETGYLTIKNGTGDEIIRLDNTGMTIKSIDTSSAFSKYIFFQRSSVNVGELAYRRYIVTGVTVSDMVSRAFHTNDSDRSTYNTIDIYNSDETTRDSFFQLNSTFVSGSFDSASIQFAKHGFNPAFRVTIDNTSGEGYLLLPTRAADPTSAFANSGSMYYDGTNIRVNIGGVWKSVVVV